jgi:hypothetical protein
VEWDGKKTSTVEGLVGYLGTVQVLTIQEQCCQECGLTSPFDGTEYGLTVLGTSAEGVRYLIGTLDFIQMISRFLTSSDSLNKKFEWIAEHTPQSELTRMLWPSKPVLIRLFWGAVGHLVNLDYVGSKDYLAKTGCNFEILVADGTNAGCLIPNDRQYTCMPCKQTKGNIYIHINI